MGSQPRYSVVIPTRNRAETLRWTLATCIAQESDDLEIVVSDNFSVDDTREVVASVGDKRVRYVRTPNSLAMTDSWEFAVGQTVGEYVTVVGDDDGLLLHAVPEIDRILRQTPLRALRWESVCYNWPNLQTTAFTKPDRLVIPLNRRNGIHCIHRHNGRKMLALAAAGRAGYWQLPMIYNSIIHRNVLDDLRNRVGRVFQSRFPDVYSAFAIAAMTQDYASSDVPLGISGRSGKSNGVSYLHLARQSQTGVDFSELNARESYGPHPRGIDFKTLSACAADAYLIARDSLFAGDSRLQLDYRSFVERCFAELELACASDWDAARRTVATALAFDSELSTWFTEKYSCVSFEEARTYHSGPNWKRYCETHFHLDTAEFGVKNVFEAAQLSEKLLGFRSEGTDAHFDPQPAVPNFAPSPVPKPGRAESPWLLKRAKHVLTRMFSKAA